MKMISENQQNRSLYRRVNNFWQILALFGYFLCLLATFFNFCYLFQVLATLSNFCHVLAAFDNFLFGHFLATVDNFEHLWADFGIFLATFGSSQIFGYFYEFFVTLVNFWPLFGIFLPIMSTRPHIFFKESEENRDSRAQQTLFSSSLLPSLFKSFYLLVVG